METSEKIKEFRKEGFSMGKIGYMCPGSGLYILQGLDPKNLNQIGFDKFNWGDNEVEEHDALVIVPPHEPIHELTAMKNFDGIALRIFNDLVIKSPVKDDPSKTKLGWEPYVEGLQELVQKEMSEMGEVDDYYKKGALAARGLPSDLDLPSGGEKGIKNKIKEEIERITENTKIEKILNNDEEKDMAWKTNLNSLHERGLGKIAIYSLIDEKMAGIPSSKLIDANPRNISLNIRKILSQWSNKAEKDQVFCLEEYRQVKNKLLLSQIKSILYFQRFLIRGETGNLARSILPFFNLLFPESYFLPVQPYAFYGNYSLSLFPALVLPPTSHDETSPWITSFPFGGSSSKDLEKVKKHRWRPPASCRLYQDLNSWWEVKEMELGDISLSSPKFADYPLAMALKIYDFLDNLRFLLNKDSEDIECFHCRDIHFLIKNNLPKSKEISQSLSLITQGRYRGNLDKIFEATDEFMDWLIKKTV